MSLLIFMALRRFDHLALELSVSAGEMAPRYALWLRLKELDWDPMDLERDHVLAFLDGHIAAFLAEHQMTVPPGELERLRDRAAQFDPDQPTPDEILERIFGAANGADR